jgi:hypothetical protein
VLIQDEAIPLINLITSDVQNLNCGYVGQRYSQIKKAACVQLLPSIGKLTLSFLLITIFAILSMMFMRTLDDRLFIDERAKEPQVMNLPSFTTALTYFDFRLTSQFSIL